MPSGHPGYRSNQAKFNSASPRWPNFANPPLQEHGPLFRICSGRFSLWERNAAVRLRITVEFTGAGSSPKNRVSFRRRELLDGLLRQRPRTRRDRGGSAAPTAHHAGGGLRETHGGDHGRRTGTTVACRVASFEARGKRGSGERGGPSRDAQRVPSSEPIRPVSQPRCDEPSNPADGGAIRVASCAGTAVGRGRAHRPRGTADGALRRAGRPVFRVSRNAGTGWVGRAPRMPRNAGTRWVGRAPMLRRALGRAVCGTGGGSGLRWSRAGPRLRVPSVRRPETEYNRDQNTDNDGMGERRPDSREDLHWKRNVFCKMHPKTNARSQLRSTARLDRAGHQPWRPASPQATEPR